MDLEMMARMDKLFHSRDPEKRAESDRLLAKHTRLADEWRRWKPVIESGDFGRLLPEQPRDDWTELISKFGKGAR